MKSAAAQSAITVRGLGKRYRLGVRETSYRTLREAIVATVTSPIRRLRELRKLTRFTESGDDANVLWALRDVDLDVRAGEVVGIIGPNGAGKSTLLKILSRITEPSEGEAIMRGRSSSLLEVGTGFHMELSGRENIYLNAAILGMRKFEIDEKLDDIIGFSGVGRFIDTPMKRYSSGMQVRLAFAVAAHVEPDILIIDEVLAVGDQEFQEKCLGRMSEMAGGGRTVLFVSHNLPAVASLCTRVIRIDHGRVVDDGETSAVIRRYLDSIKAGHTLELAERKDRSGNGAVRLTRVSLGGHDPAVATLPVTGEDLVFDIEYESDSETLPNTVVGIIITDDMGQRLTACYSDVPRKHLKDLPGKGRVSCTISRLPFIAGTYSFHLISTVDRELADRIYNVGSFSVAEGDYYGTGIRPTDVGAPVLVEHEWSQR